MKGERVKIKTDGVRAVIKDEGDNEVEGVIYYSITHDAGDLPMLDISFACSEQLVFEGEAVVTHYCGLGPVFRKNMSKAVVALEIGEAIERIAGKTVSKKKRDKMVSEIMERVMMLEVPPYIVRYSDGTEL